MNHEFENSRVYLMDCMDGMAEYPDNHFELAVVDPPYGINAPLLDMGGTKKQIGTAIRLRKAKFSSGSGKLKDRALNRLALNWDKKPNAKYFKELFRVSKNQIICGGNYFELPPTRGIICWDKKQVWDNFSQFELIWTSYDKPAKIFRLANFNSGKIHPTQKPVKLYDWIFKNYAKEGDKILDTHLGSQSSRISAYKNGLDFTGYELDEDYFRDGNKRFTNFTNQLILL